MAVIKAKTAVLAGATGPWESTDGVSNIIVGVEGRNYKIEYNLGSDLVYGISYTGGPERQSIVVAKANEVRVVANDSDVSYEVFG